MSVEIGSDGGRLRLTADDLGPRPERLRVDLLSSGLTATCLVVQPCISGFTDLAEFFERLAEDWRGWDGSRSWTSLEGDLRLTASHSGRQIAVVVKLQNDLYSRPLEGSWQAEVDISLDPGEDLARTAREVRHLVAPHR